VAALSRRAGGANGEGGGMPTKQPWRYIHCSEKSMVAREKRGELCILREVGR
jgi:hypothetical protein